MASVRFVFVILATLLVAQCASKPEDNRFRVGESARGYVIIGVAESADEREPAYAMLWRLLDPAGNFTSYDDSRAVEARTNANDTLRLDGVPGEFAMGEVQPGIYALDSVFAVLREERLAYYAQGVVVGPERPTFEVRPGEAVYLGIWEMRVEGANAATRLWRLSEADLGRVTQAARTTIGAVRVRETQIRSVPCAPHRLGNMSQRQVC